MDIVNILKKKDRSPKRGRSRMMRSELELEDVEGRKILNTLSLLINLGRLFAEQSFFPFNFPIVQFTLITKASVDVNM